jgi:uncharacterized membrane protein
MSGHGPDKSNAPPAAAPNVPPTGTDPATEPARKVELLISNLLRGGVIVSLFLITMGTALSFVHHPDYLSSRPALARLTHPGAAFPRTVAEVMQGVRGMRGQAIAAVGLMLLVATPVARVAVSILAFAYERDWAFVAITSVVFALLLLSFVLGRVEG